MDRASFTLARSMSRAALTNSAGVRLATPRFGSSGAATSSREPAHRFSPPRECFPRRAGALPLLLWRRGLGRGGRVLAAACIFFTLSAGAGGVTFITHGLSGNVDGWVTGMANRITNYSRFPGTNATIYKAYFYSTNSSYYLTAARAAG